MKFSDKILEEYRSYGAYGGVELRERGQGGVGAGLYVGFSFLLVGVVLTVFFLFLFSIQ